MFLHIRVILGVILHLPHRVSNWEYVYLYFSFHIAALFLLASR